MKANTWPKHFLVTHSKNYVAKTRCSVVEFIFADVILTYLLVSSHLLLHACASWIYRVSMKQNCFKNTITNMQNGLRYKLACVCFQRKIGGLIPFDVLRFFNSCRARYSKRNFCQMNFVGHFFIHEVSFNDYLCYFSLVSVRVQGTEEKLMPCYHLVIINAPAQRYQENDYHR